MAEGILRKRLRELARDSIDVCSAGVNALNGLPPSDGTVKVMAEEGVDVSGFSTKNVTADMINRADLILTMTPAHKDEILAIAPEAASKTYLLKEYENPSAPASEDLSVHDPMGQPIKEYRTIRDEIKKEIERFVEKL